MHRFRISTLEEGVFRLCGPERDHLAQVLRLRPGDIVGGFDNSGQEWLGRIEQIGETSVACRILSVHRPDVEARTQVYLVVGLTKGEKMEWVIQKGTELGMAGLLPLRAKRSVPHLEGQKAAERISRWQRIAAEATKQSRRVQEPQIAPVCAWSEIRDHLPPDTQYVLPYEGEQTRRLRHVIPSLDPAGPVAVIIGPEGGFEEAEATWAEQHLRAQKISLGKRILRAETAAITSLTLILSHYGDIG
ncbi:MAG: 16S rRNA (uracil(1498)-N(3))-methyltransferase [Peptococcaceae bacterium]|nr:16S rRNA (uracil(1498)-N(3))-methyltransferase [Peptococcaceae bacterium]